MNETGIDDLEHRLKRALISDPPYRSRPSNSRARWLELGVVVIAITAAVAAFTLPEAGSALAPGRPERVTPPQSGSILVNVAGRLELRSSSGALLRELGSGERLVLESVSPSGEEVVLLSEDRHSIVLLSLRDGHRRTVVQDSAAIYTGAEWSLNGNEFYYIRIPASATRFDPWTVHRASRTTEIVDITPRPNAAYFRLVPLPDRRLVFESQARTGIESMTIFVTDRDGRETQPLLGQLPLLKTCQYPALAKDGARLAISCATAGPETRTLVIYELGSGQAVEFPSATLFPKWTIDGRIAGLADFERGRCPTEVVWVDPSSRQTSLTYQDNAASLSLKAAVGDVALIEAARCVEGQSVGETTAFWLDAAGRTYEVARRGKVLWVPNPK